MVPTTVEVDPNRSEFILHPKGERLHECNVTIKPHTNKLDTVRWNRSSASSHAEGRPVDERELSPPFAKVRLRINVHNLRHCARGAPGGTAVVGVMFLQKVSSHLFGERMNLTQSPQEHQGQRVSRPGSRRAKKLPPRCAPPQLGVL